MDPRAMTPTASHDASARPPLSERLLMVLLRLVRLVLRVVTWPLRMVRRIRRPPIRIVAFRGFGSGRRLVVRGRLVDTAPIEPADRRGRLSRLRTMFRRLSTPPVPAARIEGRAAGVRATTSSDSDGMFGRAAGVRATASSDSDGMFTLHLDGLALEPAGQWQAVDLVADAGERRRARARAEALIVPAGARYGVISDIDDTVVFTGVANRLRMMWTLFATEADSRVAFDGVGAFYRALHGDGEASARRPIFYVSRGPWSIYPVLEEFFQQHRIPVGPIMLLRDWGIHLAHPWPRRARDHKRALIDELLTLSHDLPFILVGDSGQHDPEIYADAVDRWGSRIACSYIRDVTDDPDRAAEIEHAARRVAEHGSEMVLAADTATMARHAAARGLIAPADVARIEQQAERDRQAA
jgi:phosphatidate phosphatase APP1